MTSKTKLSYQCNACGAIHSKWAGQCVDCGAWNTLVETVAASRPALQVRGYAGELAVQTLAEVDPVEHERLASGIGELDRVLGGGIVRGSVVLIGGDPGIGKSTLLLQMTGTLPDADMLYVSGEESIQQTSLRARRLGLGAAPRLLLLTETCVENILAVAASRQPDMMVVDSIQTLYTEQLQSAPGSIAQLRECTAQLVRYAKRTDTTIFLVGHVTKEGALAGPRVLEHMVDTVL